MWIGTQYGLNRYDGHSFKLYTKEVHHLFNNKNIRRIDEDKQGNCVVCKKHVKGHVFKYDEAMETSKKSPFGALKDLKITKN